MGACNSKKPSDPSSQADSCQNTLPAAKSCEQAPITLLGDNVGDSAQIKAAKANEPANVDEIQPAGSPTALAPSSPTQGQRSPAPSPEKDAEPVGQPETPAPAAADSPPAPCETPKEAFEAALAWVKGPENSLKGVPNERKLNLYKFYKQATEGNVKGAQPWAAQIEARAKWDAWNAAKGLSPEDAMKRYVEELESQKRDFAGK